MVFDSHTHSEELPSDGRKLLLAGTDLEQAQRAVALRLKHPKQVHIALGLHPWWAKNLTLDLIDEQIENLAPLWRDHAQAVGETGLDFSPRHLAHETLPDTRGPQEHAFRLQLRAAKNLGLPLVLHIVRAEERACEILREEFPLGVAGMVHGFSAGREQAAQLLKLGLHLSIGGAVLQDQFKRLLLAIEAIPEERLLIESESPGEPDQEARLFDVAEKLASLRGSQAKHLLKQSQINLCRLLSPPLPTSPLAP